MKILNFIKSFGVSAFKLLTILIFIDIFFILCHVVIALFLDYQPRFLLTDTDRGLPEIYQYLKFISIVGICSYLIFSNKKYRYLPWMLLFLFMLLDDSLQIHEHMGAYLAESFNLETKFGLRPRDWGEIIYAGFIGFIVFGALAFCYYKGSKIYRKTCVDISLLLALLIFFGIGIDAVHQWLVDVDVVSAVVALIEDGGEMIALSFLAWYFYYLRTNKESQRTYIIDSFRFAKKNPEGKESPNRTITF